MIGSAGTELTSLCLRLLQEEHLRMVYSTGAGKCGEGCRNDGLHFESVSRVFYLVSISERRQTWQLHTSQEDGKAVII